MFLTMVLIVLLINTVYFYYSFMNCLKHSLYIMIAYFIASYTLMAVVSRESDRFLLYSMLGMLPEIVLTVLVTLITVLNGFIHFFVLYFFCDDMVRMRLFVYRLPILTSWLFIAIDAGFLKQHCRCCRFVVAFHKFGLFTVRFTMVLWILNIMSVIMISIYMEILFFA